MVYKIQGDFNENNFEKILSKLAQKCIFIYVTDTMYVSLKSIEYLDDSDTFIKSVFKPARSFLITKINEQNILKEDFVSGSWCKDQFVRLEKQLYEKNEQEKLQATWQAMDRMESELEKLKAEKEIERKEDG